MRPEVTRQGKPAAGCLSPVVSLRPRTAFTRWKEIPLPRSSRAGRGRRGLRLAPAGLRHGTWRARLTISGSTRPTSSGHERMCVEGSRIYERKAIGEAVRPGRGSPLPSSGVSASRRPNARRPGLSFASLASQGFLGASARAAGRDEGARRRECGRWPGPPGPSPIHDNRRYVKLAHESPCPCRGELDSCSIARLRSSTPACR